MLSAAAWAINFAESNGTVPATAPATFQAGVYFGYSGKDERALIEECFAPDQKIADDTNDFIAAIKTKDFGSIKDIVAGDEAIAIKDADKCMTDPKYQVVHDAYYYQQDIVEKAMADPDWQLHALKTLKPHLAEIKDLAGQAVAAWDAADYYGAGTAIGKIDKIAFSYWASNSFLQ